MRSKRILRQLKKAFGDELAQEEVSYASPDLAAAREKFWETFPEFLSSVDDMYAQLDDRANLAQRSLELSSAELSESNSRLFSLNKTFDAVLNSLGQGFLLLGPDGVSQSIYSKACETLLEVNPRGKHVAEILRVAPEKDAAFREWFDMLFQELLDFDDLAPLGPKLYPHSAGRVIQLEYKPVRNTAGVIEFVLLIATDFTREVQATEKALEVQAFANFISAILANKTRFLAFVKDFREKIAHCSQFVERRSVKSDDYASLKATLHGLKGASGLFGMLRVERLIHHTESDLVEMQSAGKNISELASYILDISATFEGILNENSEILKELLQDSSPQRQIGIAALSEFDRELALLGPAGEALRHRFVERFIAEPIFSVLAGFNADLKQTAKLLGKSVEEIQFTGANLPIVRENYAAVLADLNHLFRNIVDHGLEEIPLRTAAGKPAAGRVTIHVERLNSQRFYITVCDDGAGINEERLTVKLAERGITPASREELLDSIFRADVSTAQRVTELSGRGVGLFALRERVQELGGRVWVTSQVGAGTKFHLELPLVSWLKK